MKLIFVLCAVFLFQAFAGESNTYKCGNRLVKLGMSFEQVTKTCGKRNKPAEVKRYSVDKGLRNYRYSDGTMPIETEQIEEWHFAPYGKFVTIVYFNNGRVNRIFQTSKRAK